MTRLLLSQVLPLTLITVALVSVLGLTVRMTSILRDLSDHALGALSREAALHRAGWGADVSMRRALAACQAGASDEDAERQVREKSQPLRVLLATPDALHAVNPLMVDIAQRYLQLVDDASPASCASMANPTIQARRRQLDEELTDAWVDRLKELHGTIASKEREATSLGGTAVVLGTIVAGIALVASLLLARRLSIGIRRPLLTLQRLASRIGEGDFTHPVHPEGPYELQELAAALERMRRRLLEVDALKQGFLASVTHELRTPLSKLRESLSLLADGVAGPVTERQARVISLAQNACEREIRLVTTLLDLSRLRSGTPLQTRAGTAIDGIIQSAVSEERDEAQARDIQIVVDVTEGGSGGVGVYDPALCERAIANLLRNAIAVSNAGQQVTIRRRREPVDWTGAARPCVVVDVEDHGPGVPPHIRNVIFDAFVTASVEQSPKNVGVGLGLALAREVARAHQGELRLEDGPINASGAPASGPGTRFSLWLPLSATADLEPPASSSMAQAKAVTTTMMTTTTTTTTTTEPL